MATIKRRDFLNGMAIAVGGMALNTITGCSESISSVDDAKPKQDDYAMMDSKIAEYPPAKMGLRGNHDGSFETMHELSWQKKQYDLSQASHEGSYDLIVVGAGISGLVAAYRYHKLNPKARIIILDNHDDFGGHAKRCEMSSADVMRLTYGGSESFDHPKENFSEDILVLMNELGIDYKKFDEYYDHNFNKRHNLVSGVFYNTTVFGRDAITADPTDTDNAMLALEEAPMPLVDKQMLAKLIDDPEDYLASMDKSQRTQYANSTSYDNFLKEKVGATQKVLEFLQDICLEYWGFAIDHLSLMDAIAEGYPATGNLGFKMDAEDEPYIYHFPDGNASVARLLVRAIIPAVSTSNAYQAMSPMEAIVLDKFDYTQLDMPNHNVHLRLNSSVISASNDNGRVLVGYKKDNHLSVIDAKHCIMAGNHRLIPYLMPQIGDDVKQAFSKNIRTPLIYTKILVDDWQAFKDLGVYSLYCPKSDYCLVQLDYPVSLGGYHFPKDTKEPMIIHMSRVPVPYGTGKDAREACKIGRGEVYAKSFSELENQAITQLEQIFALAGATLRDKIREIVIHRWGHGYSYEQNRLYDSDAKTKRIWHTVQKPVGNIHFACSDASWTPYMHGAITEAIRAVDDVIAQQ